MHGEFNMNPWDEVEPEPELKCFIYLGEEKHGDLTFKKENEFGGIDTFMYYNLKDFDEPLGDRDAKNATSKRVQISQEEFEYWVRFKRNKNSTQKMLELIEKTFPELLI